MDSIPDKAVADLDPRYPIGRFRREESLSRARREELIGELAELPSLLRGALDGVTDEEWELPYRDGGWTVRQVVHHLADSHMNAVVRIRLALTEEVPTIKPYLEARWAELPDVLSTSPALSLSLLEALHGRWVALLRGLAPDDFSREMHHPEHDRRMSIDAMLDLYAWHGRHHVAHIVAARARRIQPEQGG